MFIQNMQRLNIPLRTGQSTTRPSRRVVWPVIFIVGAVLVFYMIAQMIVGRTTLAAGAPAGGEVFDIVGRRALTTLAEHLGDVPLLSNKPVTLNSLLPYLRREALYEVLPDNSRLIAFRGQLTGEVIKNFQDFGVWVGDFGGVTVLSDTPQDLSAWKTGLGLHLASVFPGYAGTGRLESKSYAVSVVEDGVSLWKYRSLWPRGRAPTLPQETVALIPFDSTLTDFSAYFGSLFGLGLDQSMQSLLVGRIGTVLLTFDENGWGYRLSLDGVVESQKLVQILQNSVALSYPTTATETLSDGTVVDELRLDLDQVKMSMEETPSGVLVRAEWGEVSLVARRSDEETVITNRSLLLDLQVEEKILGSICGNETAMIYPRRISQALPATLSDPKLSLWNQIDFIGISLGKYKICW